MQASQIPTKVSTPFASSALAAYIRAGGVPIPSQIGITINAASFTDGFPPSCFQAGGAPDGKDFNALLLQMTAWDRWVAAGGPIFYDAGFSTAIGGYPSGAMIRQAAAPSAFWISTVDNNTSNPDTGGANWLSFTTQPSPTNTSTLTTVSPQSVSGSVYTTVDFPGTATGFTNASGVLTCTSEGVYSLSTTIFTSQYVNITSICTFVEILKGSDVIAQNSDSMQTTGTTTVYAVVGSSTTAYLFVGDTIRVKTNVYNNGSASSQTFMAGSLLTISKVR